MGQSIHPDDRAAVGTLVGELRGGVFASDSTRRECVQRLNRERVERWNNIGNCHFPLCRSDAIARSHSLSDKAMIDPIAERRQVVGPKVNTFEGRYEVGHVPASKASVFPGFCAHHEASFTFEKAGEISCGPELQMQLFRSICRQMFFLEHERDSLSIYRSEMESKLKERIEEAVRAGLTLKTPFDDVLRYSSAELLGLVDLMLNQRTKDLEFTSEQWYEPNARSFGSGLPACMHDELITCPKTLPIVLSGPILMPGTQRGMDGTPDFSGTMYVNLFPNDNGTLIHLVALQARRSELAQLATALESDGAELKSSIEYWLVHCCDHWYMSPSFWGGLAAEIKAEVLEAMNPCV